MAAGLLEEQYNDIMEENHQYEWLINEEKDNLASLDKEVKYKHTYTVGFLKIYLYELWHSTMWFNINVNLHTR